MFCYIRRCLQPPVANTSQIFPPTTGGAQRMCEELGLTLLGKVPLDPRIGTGETPHLTTVLLLWLRCSIIAAVLMPAYQPSCQCGTGMQRAWKAILEKRMDWCGRSCDEGKSFLNEVPDSPAAAVYRTVVQKLFTVVVKRERECVGLCLSFSSALHMCLAEVHAE
ncbi:hypothetical protein NFI96_005511 [Prochilodus magdalenae]|nr:hypothetical protein NFI96_005511 [Prochilodus magdalenae]